MFLEVKQQARRASRCVASHMKEELHHTKNIQYLNSANFFSNIVNLYFGMIPVPSFPNTEWLQRLNVST